MWIRLHMFQSSDEIVVQTQNICSIFLDQRKQYKGVTCIQFNGAEDNYIQVKETIDEIGAMITE